MDIFAKAGDLKSNCYMVLVLVHSCKLGYQGMQMVANVMQAVTIYQLSLLTILVFLKIFLFLANTEFADRTVCLISPSSLTAVLHFQKMCTS